MQISTNIIAEKLLKSHIKPSYSRLKIMEYILNKRSHPTVEEIYTILLKELPTLSKTTVYNTLNVLMEAKLIQLITIEDNETRYDADLSEHGHFKCEKCGKIYDFSISLDDNPVEGLIGFRIDNKNVYFKGVCPGCLDNTNNN